MTGRFRPVLLAFALAVSAARVAHADVTQKADAVDQSAKAAYAEHKYAFCTEPTKPLRQRQQNLCELAAEIDGCSGYLKACDASEPKSFGWLERLAEWIGPIAQVLLYVLVAAIAILVAIPLVRALLRLRRERRKVPATNEAPNVARLLEAPPEPTEALSDAEAALQLAEQLRARGDLKASLALYLAASLVALDRRGAIRLARHRTNGEYVRSCEEEAARAPLRTIVREVDRIEFGGAAPQNERVADVARHAQSIVRSATVVLAIALVALGCTPTRPGADPAGDELPTDVLVRNGFKVGSLATSIATMPIPEEQTERAAMPVVIVDMEKVPLEDDAQAHLVRWVEAGGVLVLFGNVAAWPSALHAKSIGADTRDLVVLADPSENDEASDDDDADDAVITGARAARRDAFESDEGAEPVAFLGKRTYAALHGVGNGIVLAVANDDLFTNVGMMPRRNPAALVTLLRSVARSTDLKVARAEDGVPPPANPFAALVAAGLGKGAWHALVAALLLFLAYGVRHARPRAGMEKERRAFAEHVDATAALYGRTRAHAHALAAYGRFVEARLREAVPGGGDTASFLASRSGVDAARIAELYGRATEAKDDDETRGDELSVIEELSGIVAKAFRR